MLSLRNLRQKRQLRQSRHGGKLASDAPFRNSLCRNHHRRQIQRLCPIAMLDLCVGCAITEEALDKGRHLRHLRQMRHLEGNATVSRGIIASCRYLETRRMMCEELDHFHLSVLCSHQLPRLDPSHPPCQPDHELLDCHHRWIDAAFSDPGWCRSSHCSISCGVQSHSRTRHVLHRNLAFHDPFLHRSSRW